MRADVDSQESSLCYVQSGTIPVAMYNAPGWNSSTHSSPTRSSSLLQGLLNPSSVVVDHIAAFQTIMFTANRPGASPFEADRHHS